MLGFVAAVEPAEEGIMSLPPRQNGKRIVGRYLLMRIIVGTLTLACLILASIFWLKSYNQGHALFSVHDNNDANSIMAQSTEPSDEHGRILLAYYLEDVRASAFNVLIFGAITVTLSARFTYLSSCHSRVARGNSHVWTSIMVVAILQLLLMYIPGSTFVFEMKSMDGRQWGIVVVCMIVNFLVMEIEKAYRRHLKYRGKDMNGRQYGVFGNDTDGTEDIDEVLFLEESSRLGLV